MTKLLRLFIVLQLLIASSEALAQEITAVLLRNFRPLSYLDERSQKPAGFGVDLMDAIAAAAGLQVSYLMVNNWQEAEDSLKNGAADICPVMALSDERQKHSSSAPP